MNKQDLAELKQKAQAYQWILEHTTLVLNDTRKGQEVVHLTMLPSASVKDWSSTDTAIKTAMKVTA